MWIQADVQLSSPIDAIIFDIDGVIWDAQTCFDSCTAHVVDWLLRERFGAAAARPVSTEEIACFKQAGGFNIDQDLTWTLVALRRAEAAGFWNGRKPSYGQLAAQSGGQGLAWAQSFLPSHLHPDYDLVSQVYDEFYWGEQLFSVLGVRAQHVQAPGFALGERPLMTEDLLQQLMALGIAKFGAITGRAAAEAVLPLTETGLSRVIPAGAVVTRDLLAKPDPAALHQVVAALDSRCGLYCGDNRDDLDLVLNYRAERPQSSVYSVMVVTDEAALLEPGASFYARLGADAIIQHVARLPDLVRAFNQKSDISSVFHG